MCLQASRSAGAPLKAFAQSSWRGGAVSPKSETRNPKSETNSNDQNQKKSKQNRSQKTQFSRVVVRRNRWFLSKEQENSQEYRKARF